MSDKTTQRVNEAQVRKAVAALLKHIENQKASQKNMQLLDQDEMFNVVVALKKTPSESSNKPISIAIPNPLYTPEEHEVCLFVKDAKEGKGHKEAKARVKQIENSGVQKVIGVQKLKANYFPYEAKRQLCNQYDLFLADERIIAVLPKLLGKSFFKKKKQPIPVKLNANGDWETQIKRALKSTYTFIKGGNTLNVRAARSSQDEDDIVDNIMAAVQNTALHVPQKWNNVQSIYLKTDESVALPIYTSMPTAVRLPPGTASEPKSSNKQINAEEVILDDVNDSDSEDESEDEPATPAPKKVTPAKSKTAPKTTPGLKAKTATLTKTKAVPKTAVKATAKPSTPAASKKKK